MMDEDKALKEMQDMVFALPDEERDILTDLYGLDGSGRLTMMETASRHGCSVEHVRQVETEALRHLRRADDKK